MQGACADIDSIVSLSCTFLKKVPKEMEATNRRT